MPTLEDVAKRAGVSTATVSKVLSNTPYFTESTRSKVMQAVKEIGYVPHLAGRALSSGKTQIIAVVFPYIYDAVFTDPLVLRILEGIEVECSQRGYNLLLSTPRLSEDGLDALYLQLIHSGYIDGVIALDNVPFASVLGPVVQKGIPAVTIGYHPNDYYVRSDDFAGGRLLMEHVLQLGHRRIGVIGVPDNLNFGVRRRMEGMRAAYSEAGGEFDALPKMLGDFSMAGGSECAAQLLQQCPNLTALVCINDRMAMGAIQQAHLMGKRLPEQLTIVGYDDIPMAAVIVPPLTTVDQKALTLGHEAARMLFDLLNGQTPAARVLPVELIVRQSSAALS